MSSMPAALWFLSAAMPFLYSSSLNADTNDGVPSTVGSAGHLGFFDRFSVAIRCGVSPEGTVAVEISYYDVRLDSLSQWRE